MRISFSLGGGLEPDGTQEGVEVIDDALVQAIKCATLLFRKFAIAGNGFEKPCSKRGIDALEQLEEEEAYSIALPDQAIAAGVGHLFH
jgi:hypothetical protein